MVYVSVKEETSDRLVLCREPSARAWAILIAVISVGLGAAFYSVDYLLWKMAYISGAVFVGLSCMEDWEECVLDKQEGKVKVKKQSLIQKIWETSEGQKVVAAELDELIAVKVHKEDVKYGTVAYLVSLKFSSGFSIGVTETAAGVDKSEHEQIAEKIHKFLQLDLKHAQIGTPLSEAGSFPGDDNSSTTSDDSFEQIDKAELVDEVQKEDPPGEASIRDNINSEVKLDSQDPLTEN